MGGAVPSFDRDGVQVDWLRTGERSNNRVTERQSFRVKYMTLKKRNWDPGIIVTRLNPTALVRMLSLNLNSQDYPKASDSGSILTLTLI